MSKVYLVTAGSYSDYHVVAAFSCPDKAQHLADICDEAGVEEFELDAALSNIIYTRVRITREGRVVDMRKDVFEQCSPPSPTVDRAGCLRVWAAGEDEQCAVKVANEKRSQWIAEGKRWPTPHGSWGPE